MGRKANIATFVIGKKEIVEHANALEIEKLLEENDMAFLLFKREDLKYLCKNYDAAVTYLCEMSKKTKTEIITGILYVKMQETLMENSIYIDKNGDIQGSVLKKYDEQQLSHADKFEKFQTSIGAVGIILGKDLWSIEITRILALKGVEVLFAPDIRILEQECEEQHILGIAVYNCLNILYCRQEKENSRFIFVSPEGVQMHKDMGGTEKIICEVDMDKIDAIRKPDPTFQNTMWWLLYGRRPEQYKEILMDYSFKI